MASANELLKQAASEMRAFSYTRESSYWGAEWLFRLADRMESAASIAGFQQVREVDAIAHILADSGPNQREAAPSFWTVRDTQLKNRRST